GVDQRNQVLRQSAHERSGGVEVAVARHRAVRAAEAVDATLRLAGDGEGRIERKWIAGGVDEAAEAVDGGKAVVAEIRERRRYRAGDAGGVARRHHEAAAVALRDVHRRRGRVGGEGVVLREEQRARELDVLPRAVGLRGGVVDGVRKQDRDGGLRG